MAGAHYVDSLARQSPTWGAIIAPTSKDARHDCVEGPTGLLSFAPDIHFNRSSFELAWPNGSKARLFGTYTPKDVDRLRGAQHHWVWAEELASWPQLDGAWVMMDMGLRLGANPTCVITTTPKPRETLKGILRNTRTVVARATTYDNPYLTEDVRQRYTELYESTRLGRQELYGELLEDVEGALWQWEWIERGRVLGGTEDAAGRLPPLRRTVVAIDPAVTHKRESDETGIAVVGQGEDGEYYVLHVAGYRLSPAGWARRALSLFDQYQADRIIAERNNGGEMVEHTIRMERRDVPIKTIVASRGKVLRAEPIAALYEQGRIHHIGIFLEAEEQMCSFPVANEHDDLVDALVYGLTELSTPQKKWGLAA